MPYGEIGFKTNLAYLEVDKIEYLMTLISSRPVNRLPGQRVLGEEEVNKLREVEITCFLKAIEAEGETLSLSYEFPNFSSRTLDTICSWVF
ncbi:hypothetical protein MTR_5g459430 [Medicago truncatula]|uniref:Uncharacterized protein n=1 Tax=Medicago truncatula TaxID=3880 RepID=A0A072UE12_MEDTR|nr:hypothetical protein MTR_5g459430 [Medicago truncatula]